jgi:EmrB/QacA subfamily drug resistance transporter
MLRSSRLVPLVVAAGLFMENMDQTVIATSLPAMATDLGTDPVTLKLAFTSYLLSLAVFIPISGWAADRYGARVIFQLAMTVFTLGSIGCGFSNSLASLIGFRMLQGVGGAMMVPVARLIILRLVPRHEMLQALTYLTVPALIGPVIGPPLGGFITTYYHWRWIFWINVPVCLFGIALAYWLLPEVKEDRPESFDWSGFALSGIGLSALLFGVTLIGRASLSPAWPLGLLAAGAAMAALYLRHARRVAHPILDLRLFADPSFHSGVLAGALFRVGIGALPFLLPLLLQIGFGMTPFAAGSLTFAAAGGAMLMKTTAHPILRRFGFRRVLMWNGLISAALMAATVLLTAQTAPLVIGLLFLVGGFLRSLQFTALNAITFADIPDAKLSVATTLASVTQQLAGSLGVAIAALVIEASEALRGTQGLDAWDLAAALLALSAIAALSVPVHARLPATAGRDLVANPTVS